MNCEHYKHTGTPHDFRFPCAHIGCPAGVKGFELCVPVMRTGEHILTPPVVKVYERWRTNHGTVYWKEQEGGNR